LTPRRAAQGRRGNITGSSRSSSSSSSSSGSGGRAHARPPPPPPRGTGGSVGGGGGGGGQHHAPHHPHPHYDARALHEAAERSNEAGALQISALLGGVMALMVLPWAAHHPPFLALPALVLCAPGAIGGGARSAAREAAAGLLSAARMAAGLAAETRERREEEQHEQQRGRHQHQHQHHRHAQQGPASPWYPPPAARGSPSPGSADWPADAPPASSPSSSSSAGADPRVLPREERARRYTARGVEVGRPPQQ
jgi:hypothetical protein